MSEFTAAEALLNVLEQAVYQARLKIVQLLSQCPALEQEDPKLSNQLKACCQRIDESGEGWEILNELMDWLDDEVEFAMRVQLTYYDE